MPTDTTFNPEAAPFNPVRQMTHDPAWVHELANEHGSHEGDLYLREDGDGAKWWSFEWIHEDYATMVFRLPYETPHDFMLAVLAANGWGPL
jgi:hypothetical protein